MQTTTRTTTAHSREQALEHLNTALMLAELALTGGVDVAAFWRQMRHDLHVLGVTTAELDAAGIGAGDRCPICGQHAMDPNSTCNHVLCDSHGWTTATDQSGPGFAGGTIIHVTYGCGCVEHDETDDVAAAR